MTGMPAGRRGFRSPAGLLAVGALAFSALLAAPVFPHNLQDKVPPQVGVDERLGARIPGDLPFRDQAGRSVLLSDYFTGAPVILTLNYFACPTLCPLVFRNLAGTAARMGDLALGRDFRIVTVSINPDESAALAREKSASTYAMLAGAADPGSSWPFLMGSQGSIERLAGVAGVRYTRLSQDDFAHPNVIIILTPDGRVSRYLYGLELQPRDLKLALLEASGGRIGATNLMNRALLYCYHYDPVGKKYVLFASRLMTLSMLAVLLLTLGLLAFLWKRERKAPPPA